MMEQRKPGPGKPMGVLDWRRTVASLGRQVDDPDALAQAYTVLDAMEAALVEAGQRLRREGYSLAELARPFGMTRQNARKRWPLPTQDGAAVSGWTCPCGVKGNGFTAWKNHKDASPGCVRLADEEQATRHVHIEMGVPSS